MVPSTLLLSVGGNRYVQTGLGVVAVARLGYRIGVVPVPEIANLRHIVNMALPVAVVVLHLPRKPSSIWQLPQYCP
jgi:hypothetical protein